MSLLTTAEAAERLSLSERTVRREIDAGRLPAVRIGRTVRLRLEDIEKLILSSLSRGAPVCPSKNVVTLGGSVYKSAARRLDALLAPAPPKRTRSNTKQRYAETA